MEDVKVRHFGDEVVAVAAVSEEVAEKALELIKVVYEPLPVVLDPEEAMKPGAPLVHDEKGSNIAGEYHWNLGEVEKGFKEADHIFEDRFVTSQHCHVCPETHGCVANWDPTGRLTIWVGTQSPFPHRMQYARTLDIPVGKVRVVNMTVGGAYGSKYEMHPIEPIAAHLSKLTGKPVMITLSREEEFIASRTRHPMIIKLKTAVKKDGTITARHATIIMDKGAYVGQGEGVLTMSGWGMTTAYKGAVKFDGYIVHTNKNYGGAFRGYGLPQTQFAVDSQMHMIAKKLGLDPLDLMLKNVYHTGDVTVSNCQYVTCGLSECLENAAASIGYKEKKREKIPYHGLGLSGGICFVGSTSFFVTGDPESAQVTLSEDGSFNLAVGGSDMGQGYYTTMLMIAAEELGVPYENVRIIKGDTDVTTMGISAYADRLTFMSGNAVKLASADAKRQILDLVAEKFEARSEDMLAEGDKISVRGSPEKSITVAEAAKYCIIDRGTPILGRAVYNPDSKPLDITTGLHAGTPGLSPTYGFSAQAIEVEVDPQTFQVKVLNVASCHDCGRVINRSMAEAQVEGGISQILGYSLVEGLKYDENGKVVNSILNDYRIYSATDVPKIIPLFLDKPDPKGPFGAKGLGEQFMVTGPAAIANAIYDAIGVRITELPITPEKIYKEFKERQS